MKKQKTIFCILFFIFVLSTYGRPDGPAARKLFPVTNCARWYYDGYTTCENTKFGFIDKNGKEVLPLNYGFAYSFFNGMALVSNDGVQSFINADGKTLFNIGRRNDWSNYKANNGLIEADINGSRVLLNIDGSVIVKDKLDDIFDFSEGLAGVERLGKYGYIDESGQIKVPLKYLEAIKEFKEGLAAVNKGGSWGYIDKTGAYIIVPRFKKAESFSCGRAAVMVKGKWGYIDKTGVIIIKPEYSFAQSFEENIAIVEAERKWGVIDLEGKVIIPVKYEWISDFKNGIAYIKINKKVGFIDKSGKMIIEPQFDEAINDFSGGGVTPVRVAGNWGYIDISGKFVIRPQFFSAEPFRGDMARVQMNEKYGYINIKGEYIIQPMFDEIRDCNSFDGPCQGFYEDGVAKAVKGDEAGYIDKTGKFIWSTMREKYQP